ncbi:hypothetical protein MNB_SV-12-209 [hydrothermal vent metagenome]|uniref:Uncharacterized protein n=1 Tax=hydrothermal vent metagenome TaxID=652676 RepID=A0A1W1C1T1_9ZZZZ
MRSKFFVKTSWLYLPSNIVESFVISIFPKELKMKLMYISA